MKQKNKYFLQPFINEPQSHFNIVKHCQTFRLTATLLPPLLLLISDESFNMKNKKNPHMKHKH